ncbi:MAG: hypothetical protein JSW16_08150 [Dehalococcoidales bacterium]|nr:MAG: hypothetical protein JSW16_08150 [Dehalococcoidales bacterium]
MDNNQSYKTFANTQRAMLKIEEDWLQSINAPVTALPSQIVEAVATRVLLTGLPLEYILKFMEDIESGHVKGKTGSVRYGIDKGLPSARIQNRNGHQLIKETDARQRQTIIDKPIAHPDARPPAITYHSTVGQQKQPVERKKYGTRSNTKEALEYNTAFYIVDFFRRSLADIGYLGLSDDDILKATEQALKGEMADSGIVMHIQAWLDGDLNPFKPSLQKVFGDYPVYPKSTEEEGIEHYTKAELLQKTGEIIQDFHSQLANFGWSGLLYHEVYEATKLALKINFFDEARDEINHTLQPIAWHIHVLLQEAEYAHLKPILEEGLKSPAKEVLQATVNAAKSNRLPRKNKTLK